MATTTKIPARDFDWHINTGTVGAPTWVAIGGLAEWGHTPTGNDADTTTFDEGGALSHMKITRGHAFTLTGLYKEDVANGDRDAGQEAVETLGDAVGAASVKQFRITSPGGTTKTFSASATVTVGGGNNAAATSWSAALVVDGVIVTA